ncbi:MAG: CvpA family protein [Anaerolineaceae bacterium]|nr:CvpA family protein [Anaerolineaceae bacterium]
MVSLSFLLWVFIIIFAIIGSMRGWAKELLVVFSIVLALVTMTLLEAYLPFYQNAIDQAKPATIFWLKSVLLLIFLFIGHQLPKIPKLASSGRFMQFMFYDKALGAILGGFNGYLVFGTIWYFLHNTNYPLAYVLPPDVLTEAGRAALQMVEKLPPSWLMTTPTLYIAFAVCFVIVVVVFI